MLNSQNDSSTATSLADFVDVWPNNRRILEYQDVLGVIDGIHKVAYLPQTKINAMDYLPWVKPGLQGVCIPNPSTGAPATIGISETAITPRFTMLHEFGHCIEYGAEQAGRIADNNDCVNAHNFIRSQIRASAEYRKLVSVKKGAETLLLFYGTTANTPEMEASKRQLEHVVYLLRRDELFARAYSQYIAVKSSRQDIMDELNTHIGFSDNDAYCQWQGASFNPIAEAFERLFSILRWLK